MQSAAGRNSDGMEAPATTRDVRHAGLRRRLWRVFYTQPRAELKCEERVLSAGIEVFVLKREVVRQWKDRKKRIIEPVFRSYLFARVHEGERLEVLQTAGIIKTVGFGSRFAEVSEEEIAQLRLAQFEPRLLALYDLELPPRGARVVVNQGAMKGLRGEVVEYRGAHYLVVRVEAIQQALKINVPAEWVTPVHCAA